MSVLWSTVDLIFWNNINIHTIPRDEEISSFSCDVCRYLGFFSPLLFSTFIFIFRIWNVFSSRQLRACQENEKIQKEKKRNSWSLGLKCSPTKVENHIPGFSPGNFLFKLLEISSEISRKCKAGIIETTYKWTNQIIYSNQISLYVNNSFKKIVQYFYYLVHGKLFNYILKPSIM